MADGKTGNARTKAAHGPTRRTFAAAAVAGALGTFGAVAHATPAHAQGATLLDLLAEAFGGTADDSPSGTAGALPSEEPWQAAYRAIEQAAEERRPSVTLSCTQSDALRAMRAFEYEPTSLYLDDQPKLFVGPGTARVELTYRYTPEDAAGALARCGQVADELLACIADALADADAWTRALLVHDLLCSHVRAATEEESYLDASGVQRYDDRFRRLDTALLDGVAVCQGYAVAYQFLLERAGVPCDVVVSSDHAWNTVELDGATYHVDCTYDDMDSENAWGNAYVSHARFMMDDADLAAHGLVVAQDETPCPPSGDGSQGYYARMGYTADAFDPDGLVELWRVQAQAGSDCFSTRFSSDEAYRALIDCIDSDTATLFALVGDASDWTLQPSFYQHNDGMRTVDLFLTAR